MPDGEAGTGTAGTDGAAPKTYSEAEVQALVSGLKTKNEELVGRVNKANERVSILGDRTPEQIKADLELAQQTREAKAKAEGDWDVLKKQMSEQHTAELGKVTERTKKVEGKLYDVLARSVAEAAIRAAEGNPKILLPHVLPHIRVAENGDDFSAVVIDAKGNPRIADGAGTPMTIAQLVEAFKADPDYGGAFSAPSATGSGASGSGGSAGAKPGAIVLSKTDALDTAKYRAARAEAEKRGVQLLIAS